MYICFTSLFYKRKQKEKLKVITSIFNLQLQPNILNLIYIFQNPI